MLCSAGKSIGVFYRLPNLSKLQRELVNKSVVLPDSLAGVFFRDYEFNVFPYSHEQKTQPQLMPLVGAGL